LFEIQFGNYELRNMQEEKLNSFLYLSDQIL